MIFELQIYSHRLLHTAIPQVGDEMRVPTFPAEVSNMVFRELPSSSFLHQAYNSFYKNPQEALNTSFYKNHYAVPLLAGFSDQFLTFLIISFNSVSYELFVVWSIGCFCKGIIWGLKKGGLKNDQKFDLFLVVLHVKILYVEQKKTNSENR